MSENDLPFPTHRGMKPGTLTPIQIYIATYIYTEHKGHARAILRQQAADDISERLDVNLTARKLREHIAQMVRRGLPIGVTQLAPCGYFWIETEEERVMVRDPLLNMAFSTLVHARGFDKENIVAPLLAQLRAAGFGDDDPDEEKPEPEAIQKTGADEQIEPGASVVVETNGKPFIGILVSRLDVGGKAIMYNVIRADENLPGDKGMPYLPHTVRRMES